MSGRVLTTITHEVGEAEIEALRGLADEFDLPMHRMATALFQTALGVCVQPWFKERLKNVAKAAGGKR